MTKREVGFLACRLLAVYLFMQGVLQLGDLASRLNFLSYNPSSGTLSIRSNGATTDLLQFVFVVLFQLIPFLFMGAGVIGLWLLAGEIAKRLFDGAPDSIEEGQPLIIDRDIRAVAFCCLGLFFLVNDSSYVAALITRPIIDLFSPSVPRFELYVVSPWQLFVRIAISLWLVFGARGLARLWRLVQPKGRGVEKDGRR